MSLPTLYIINGSCVVARSAQKLWNWSVRPAVRAF